MDSKRVESGEDRNRMEKDASVKWFDALGSVAEEESKRLENAASFPPTVESFTDADGKMRDLVISLARVGSVVAL